MNAQELRIGNWVMGYDEYSHAKPEQVNTGMMMDLEEGLYPCKPIELTPEILEAAGFEEDKQSEWGGWFSPMHNMAAIRVRQKIGGDWFHSGPLGDIELNSLHKLQNLYYSLTGTELEVKL